MAKWKLIIDDYGKISHAEIEMGALMLFVGDNNSGKSYLTSLLWGMHNLGADYFLEDMDDNITQEEQVQLVSWMEGPIANLKTAGEAVVSLDEIADVLMHILNRGLQKKKNLLVKYIFNSEDITIGGLRMEGRKLEQEEVRFWMESGYLHVKTNPGSVFGKITMSPEIAQKFLTSEKEGWGLVFSLYKSMLSNILELDILARISDSEIYLPSARTGFMLTKDIINKFSRNQTFNLQETEEKVAPFVRPINHFLDIMNDLSLDGKGKKEQADIADLMEKKITQGTIDISNLPNKEVRYFPSGKKDGMPLRMVSAVVTELAPLTLLLKHKDYIQRLYYEEPEMCLHPQLQHKMARILCRIVNSGIGMVVTTHSDIILQHINNMIKLSSADAERAARLGYDSSDLLFPAQVKVYQFEGNERTQVSEIPCGENGFAVPTFNRALDLIMEEAYQIQGE